MGQRQYIREAQVMRPCPECGNQSTSVYRHPPTSGRPGDYAESTRCADQSCNRLLHYSPTNLLTPGSRDFSSWEGGKQFSEYNAPAMTKQRSW